MKRIHIFLVALLPACDGALEPEPTEPVTEARLLEHLNVLAADSLRGRGAGTPYEVRAAEYIRDQFASYGLEPGVPGYLQTFTVSTAATEANTSTTQGTFVSQNVLAALPGRGSLRGQWVILGAHYDHLGFGQAPGDTTLVIYNGADDNASGTSILLEAARFLSHYYTRGVGGDEERRSMMFQAYGAEEWGLKGSFFFVENTAIPIDSIVAMVNLDMVGRLSSGQLIVNGAATSDLWSSLVSQENDANLPVWLNFDPTGRTDHVPFIQRGTPAIHLFTGLHAEYHTPDDDVWLLDTVGMVLIGELTIDMLRNLSGREDPPLFAGMLAYPN